MILIDKDGEILQKWERYCFLIYKEHGRESKGLMQILIKGSKKDKQQALFELEQG
jgi:hypothetical protein